MESVAYRERTLMVLSTDCLVPPFFGIRTEPDDVGGLVESIKKSGILEPLIVRLLKGSLEGKYEVVCGLRRFEAAKQIGIEQLLCIVMEMSDQEVAELQWVENLDRKDLSDFEKGKWLLAMLKKFPETYSNQTVLGDKIGLSQQHVSELISHFEFVEKQKTTLSSDLTARAVKLTEGVTREIQRAPKELRSDVTKAVVERGLSARETAKLVQDIRPEAGKALQETAKPKQVDFEAVGKTCPVCGRTISEALYEKLKVKFASFRGLFK